MSLTIEEYPANTHSIGKNGDAYYELESTRYRVPDEETGDITPTSPGIAYIKLTLTTGSWAQAIVGDIVLIENSEEGYNAYHEISQIITASTVFKLWSNDLQMVWLGVNEADLKVTLISKNFNVTAAITIDSNVVFTSVAYPEVSGSDYLMKYFLSKVLRKMIEYIIVDPKATAIASPSDHKNSLAYTIDFTARQVTSKQYINDVWPSETVSQSTRYAFPVIFDERYKIHKDTSTLPASLSVSDYVLSDSTKLFLSYADRDNLKIIRDTTELYFGFIYPSSAVMIEWRYSTGLGFSAWIKKTASTLINRFGILPINNDLFTGFWTEIEVRLIHSTTYVIESETLTISQETDDSETTMMRFRNTLGGVDVIRYKERDQISMHSRTKYETNDDISQFDTRSQRSIYLTKKQLTNNERLLIDEMMASSFIEISRARGSSFEWARAVIKNGEFLSINDEEDIHSLQIELKEYIINV